MGNGMNKVIDGLYLGNIKDSENRESLSQNGITHILSVYNNAKPVYESGRGAAASAVKPRLCSLYMLHSPAQVTSTSSSTWRSKGSIPSCASHPNSKGEPSHPPGKLLSAACSGFLVLSLTTNLSPRSQHFKECISFIHECRLNGGSCLVHCLAGVSRSTTMVVAYLMTVTDYTWDECLSAIKSVRSFVGPNYGFQGQLQEYQVAQVAQNKQWLQSNFRPSPFNDQEQVGALLSQYTEQEEGQWKGSGDG